MTRRGFSYGGQAVPEGVMMRGQHQATTAVRRSDGTIAYRHELLRPAGRRNWSSLPLLRGGVALWDALSLGMRSMLFATLVATGEEQQAIPRNQLRAMVAMMLGLLFGLFFVLPLLAGELLVALLPPGLVGIPGSGRRIVVREAGEGLLRLAIFVGYLGAIRRSPQVRRVFGYHGAEHKAVNAYESGRQLTVADVRACSLIHPRCGTSFLLLVIVASIIVFAFFGTLPLWARLLARIIMVPLIAALVYELVRLAAKHYHRLWMRRLLGPTLALQRLTTREPDDSMIEVAIAALVPVLKADGCVVTPPYEQTRGAAPTVA